MTVQELQEKITSQRELTLVDMTSAFNHCLSIKDGEEIQKPDALHTSKTLLRLAFLLLDKSEQELCDL